MPKILIAACVALVSVLVGVTLLAGGLAESLAAVDQPRDTAACQPLADAAGKSSGGRVGSLSHEQRNNAKIIIDAANHAGAGSFGAQVGVATAMTESTLHNLSGGDRDSGGLFQQRPSQGWGSRAQITDPKHASREFYEHLMAIPGWQHMPLTVAAQRVQRSAYPDRYAEHSSLAAKLVKQGGGGTLTCKNTGNDHGGPKVEAAIKFALAQRGKPYVWGAAGPDSYDCSGLTLQAWRKAKVKLPRVTREQYTQGKHVPTGQAKRGDLLFWSSDGSAGGIHHVAIDLGGGKMVEAQQTGVPVKTSSIRHKGLMPKAVRLAAKS